MYYELFMGEALAEARLALERGERPNAAVAVVDEAMVVRAHDRVQETNDPTAHAVVVALRETARKLGSARPPAAALLPPRARWALGLGALIKSTLGPLVSAVANGREGAGGNLTHPPNHPSLIGRALFSPPFHC